MDGEAVVVSAAEHAPSAGVEEPSRKRSSGHSFEPHGAARGAGSAGLRTLSRRMTRRMARSVPGAAPFLVGAAVGGRANRRTTETLALRVLADLRRLRP